MPNASWVAKWNGLDGMKPGIYAIGILEDGGYDDDDDYDIQVTHKKKKNKAKAQDSERSDGDAEEYYRDWFDFNIVSLISLN